MKSMKFDVDGENLHLPSVLILVRTSRVPQIPTEDTSCVLWE